MLCERLKYLRERKNLSQKEIAKKINKTPQAYNYYEKGTRVPDIETLIKLANIYSITLDYLVGRDFHSKESIKNLSPEETDHIEKYRALDERGKENVDTTLEHEYGRTKKKLDKSLNKISA